MKIGIDATALTHLQPTGVEVATRELIRALLTLDQTNQYYLYTPTPLDRSWQMFANVSNRVLPPTRRWLLSQLGPAIHQDRLDLFWSPSNLLPFKLPARRLATVHDLAFFHFPQAYSWRSWLMSWLTVWRATKLATKIIAVSHHTKQDLIQKFHLPDHRVVVVPNALPQSPTVTVTPLILDDYILVVGRVETRKNPLAAIKAFALIAADYPKLQLIFAGGDGLGATSAKQLADTLGLSHRIQFLGFVDGETLANLYAHARIALFPTLYEGFGLPVLEAFQYGVPLVASDTPAVAEVAGDAALLVEPTDTLAIGRALIRLLEEPELRTTLIEKGTLRLRQYSWERSAEELLAVINSL